MTAVERMQQQTRIDPCALHGLYAITDSVLMPDTETLLTQTEAALRGGARLIQYRDKSRDHDKRQEQALELVSLCDDFGVPFLINDDAELAKEVHASGVHLGQSDGSISAAREHLGPNAIIGTTCHNQLDLAIAGVEAQADYVAFGAFFASQTKPNAVTTPLSLLTQARETLPEVPIVAIGGITVDNAGQVIRAGANMVAVIHSLFTAPDIARQAKAFQACFKACD